MNTETIKELEEKIIQNDAYSMNELAKLLEVGEGVAMDKERAMELFEKSAALNYPNAMVNLAQRIYHANKAKALDLLYRASEMNFYGAFFVLAMYSENDEEALQHYVKAADLGCASAFYYIGCIYHNRGDKTNAYKYWKLGADKDEAECCRNVTVMCVTPGDFYNLEEALKYAKKSYNLGNDKSNFYKHLKMWNILSNAFNEMKEVKFWTAQKGETKKIFTVKSPVSLGDLDINDLSLLIFEPRNQETKEDGVSVSYTEIIKCYDFLNAFYAWKDYKEGKITLKSIKPTQKAKYIVSIFHLLENELSELE